MQDADAADLSQIVFEAVAREIRRLDYDPGRGTFRGWLWTVVRNQLHKHWARRRSAAVGVGGDDRTLDEAPDPNADEEVWNQQYQRRLFRWAADRVQTDFEDASWQAFWKTAVNGLPAKQVAAELGMSVGTCTRRRAACWTE